MYVYFLMNLKCAIELAVVEKGSEDVTGVVMSCCCRKFRRARESFVRFAETEKPARQYS